MKLVPGAKKVGGHCLRLFLRYSGHVWNFCQPRNFWKPFPYFKVTFHILISSSPSVRPGPYPFVFFAGEAKPSAFGSHNQIQPWQWLPCSREQYEDWALCSRRFADMCRGIWHRDNELSDVAGTEVPGVTFQGSAPIVPGKGYAVPVEVLLCPQGVQGLIWVFSWQYCSFWVYFVGPRGDDVNCRVWFNKFVYSLT